MYYPSSENKAADQLLGYREADLRLCFRIYQNPVFSGRGSYFTMIVYEPRHEKTNVLRMRRRRRRSASW